MMQGREILQPVDIMMSVSEHQTPQDPCDYVEELEDVLRKVHVIARQTLHEAQMRQKGTYDLRIHYHAYDVGDFVYMIDSSTKIYRKIKKATEAMRWPVCRDREIVIRPLSYQEQTKGESCAS